MKRLRIYNLCRKTESWLKKRRVWEIQDLVAVVLDPSDDSFHSSTLYLEFQSWCQSSGLELAVRKKNSVNVEVEQVKTMSSEKCLMLNSVYIGLFAPCRSMTLALRRNSCLLLSEDLTLHKFTAWTDPHLFKHVLPPNLPLLRDLYS